MNPKLVVVLVVAALLIGLMIGAGGGLLGASMFHRMASRYNRYDDSLMIETPMPVPEQQVLDEPAQPIELEAGQRAVSIKVSSDQAMNGFIRAGDRVNVLHKRTIAERQVQTSTLLREIKVLALDHNANDNSVLVSLSLTEEQANDVAAAQQDGILVLTIAAIPR